MAALKDTALLQITQLSFGFGKTPIMRDMSLCIARGAHHVLLGPSGTGKSTLIGLIAGLLPAQRGKILFEGQDLAPLRQPERDQHRARSMGLVFQDLHLIACLSIEENVAMAVRLSGQATGSADIKALLERFGIGHLAAAKPRQISRGEAQRAAIVRALAVRPKLLLADEPTASLDAASRDRVLQALFDLAQANNTTLLVATHDSAVAARFDHPIQLAAPGAAQ